MPFPIWRWKIYSGSGAYCTTNNPCEVFNTSMKRYTQRKYGTAKKTVVRVMYLLKWCVRREHHWGIPGNFWVVSLNWLSAHVPITKMLSCKYIICAHAAYDLSVLGGKRLSSLSAHVPTTKMLSCKYIICTHAAYDLSVLGGKRLSYAIQRP
ncbi:hypothetical protein PHMEG_00011939 [Phytophthora megakarya]|uniref:Uncharacterized protein n=1 Tax=Phytophthora megakarya TaxID=4795 RepID=A0A225WAB3_9STRA|nr:hypothetical protein PHMEG_00011939 [Phytophthora megakarya]